jgi:hypothetical protein
MTLLSVLLFFVRCPISFVYCPPYTQILAPPLPTLTSTSTEIYLSMAGAKQLGNTRFILVSAGAVRPAEVCSRHYIALHRNA